MQAYHVRCLGVVPYQQAWDLQLSLTAQIAAGELPPTLLLLEHPHTFTFGRKGQAGNLLWSEAELKKRGVEVYWVDRGGDVTYHGPGQLVGYPLIPLNIYSLVHSTKTETTHVPHADYVGYIRKLEQMLILALGKFGIRGERIKGFTGVWVKGSKIAAIGVKVNAQGITSHGFALNVAPNMAYWDGIIGCGLAGYSITSLGLLLPEPPSMLRVIQAIISAFEETFEVECQSVS